MAELSVSLVAMDRPVWEGQARMVVATTPEGEIGILPGHEPVLALLTDGAVRIEPVEGQKVGAVVHGGFFSVSNNKVAILADGKVDRREKDAEVRARTRLKAAMGAEHKSMHLGG